MTTDMNHAEALRGMAKAFMMVGSHERVDACLAGAEALDTAERVRHALIEIDRLDDDAWAVWERDADMYEQGRSDTYGHAHTLITEALEGETE